MPIKVSLIFFYVTYSRCSSRNFGFRYNKSWFLQKSCKMAWSFARHCSKKDRLSYFGKQNRFKGL